ncbi:hypothetical protein RB597_009319 [Gaeumannomyces tritici]
MLPTLIIACLLIPLAAGQRASNITLAPSIVECPQRGEWIRPAARGLSPAEAAWVRGRKAAAVSSLESYLASIDMGDFDKAQYIQRLRGGGSSCDHRPAGTDAPVIGMCISGGGWGSAITGVGALRAFDARQPASVAAGTGGLLQSMTHISGLSGGAWPVTSLAVGGFPVIDDLIASWRTNISRVSGVITDSQWAARPETMFAQLANKALARFNVSVADFLGQAFSWEAAPYTHGGLTFTWSGISGLNKFRKFGMPFPILQSVGLDASDEEFYGLKVPRRNSTNWEFNPFEFGTFEGPRGGFMPMEFLGTPLSTGKPMNSSLCVKAFDSVAFVVGASGNAFNFWYIASKSNGTNGRFSKRELSSSTRATLAWLAEAASKPAAGVSRAVSRAVRRTMRSPWTALRSSPPFPKLDKRTPIFSNDDIDGIVTVFKAFFNYTLQELTYTTLSNPFRNTNFTQNSLWSPDALVLADGSETLNALPMPVLARPERRLDFIIAWDDSEDVALNWQNGTNLYTSYLQSLTNAQGPIPFPKVPPPATFVARGYNHRPTLFGCDTSLTTTPERGHESPIVLYLANAPYSAFTNYSDFQSALSLEQARQVMVNSFDLVTQGNGTLARDWPRCLACAVVERSRARLGMPRAAACDTCFAKWCWDGTEAVGPVGDVDLRMALNPGVSFAEWNKTNPF